MGRKVEVSVQGFGDKALTRTFDSQELEDKDLGYVIGKILNSEWQGSDLVAYKALMRKIDSTGGRYMPQVATRPFLTPDRQGPVTFIPARVEEGINKYLGNKNELDLSITPAYVTAYR